MRSRSGGEQDRSRASADRLGKPSSAAAGASPTSSALATSPWRRTASMVSASEHLEGPLHVHRDLCHRAVKEHADRTHAGQAPLPVLADQPGDAAGVIEGRGRAELEVEGDERGPRGEQRHRPRVRSTGARSRAAADPPRLRPARRRPLEARHPLAEAQHPPAPELRPHPRRAALVRGQLPVEEDGKPSSSPSSSARTSAAAQAAPCSPGRGRRAGRHRGAHVGSADPRRPRGRGRENIASFARPPRGTRHDGLGRGAGGAASVKTER